MGRSHPFTQALCISLVAALAACSNESPTLERINAGRLSSSSGPTLVECPTDQVFQASGEVTPLGGVVSAGGTSITVPAGAVLTPTTITVTVPASRFMEVDISANGAGRFNFEAPVTITMSYARCTRSDIDKAPLTVWHIESATKALIENMGGTDDKAARTVTFGTDHLTGYVIAN